MKVLIAGLGYVGSALGNQLIESGERAVGLRRSAVRGEPPPFDVLQADLTRTNTLDAIPDDIDAVCYCASPNARSEEAYEDAYLRGPENVLEVLARRRIEVTRFVLTSSTAVYGQDDGAWVDERSRTAPTTFSGRILERAEAAIIGGATHAVVLRLSGIYGPGRTWLVRQVHEGHVSLRDAADPPRYGNRIHRDDCAGAAAHLLRLPEPEAVYVGVDEAPVPLVEVYRFIADELGIEHERAEPGSTQPGSASATKRSRGGNKRCRNDRLKQSGYRFKVRTYREGYPPIVKAFLESTA